MTLFKDAQAELADKFVNAAPEFETDDELGSALLEFVLCSERTRRGVSNPSDDNEDIDTLTVKRLVCQNELGPDFAFAEAVFKRLTNDPASAIKYFRQAAEKVSEAQAQRAKKPREGSYDSLTTLINDIIRDDPNLPTRLVFNELKRTTGIIIDDSEIRNTQDSTTMKISNFASRVSDARKRYRAN